MRCWALRVKRSDGERVCAHLKASGYIARHCAVRADPELDVLVIPLTEEGAAAVGGAEAECLGEPFVDDFRPVRACAPRPVPEEREARASPQPGDSNRARFAGVSAAGGGVVHVIDCASETPDATAVVFGELYANNRQPALLRGMDLGPCVRLWDGEHLAAAAGDKVLTAGVHVCPSRAVDLAGHRSRNTPKNFRFVAMRWREFIQRAAGLPPDGGDAPSHAPLLAEGERYYMRSVAEGKSAEKVPSDIGRIFPALAAEVRLPEGVLYTSEQFHSSVLRVASPDTALWTHYDVMDNALMQVTGTKVVTLWPPGEAAHLYVDGTSARVAEVDSPDSDAFPLLAEANKTRVRVTLRPGDVLFIPALWFHHVVSESFSVAVNVFWRGLPAAEYSAKDVYGNKDLPTAQRACEAARKAAAHLAHLPEPYRSFYARKAAMALQEACGAAGADGASNGEPDAGR